MGLKMTLKILWIPPGIVADIGRIMKGRTWILSLDGWGLGSLLQVGVEGLSGSIGARAASVVGDPGVAGHLHWQHVCYPKWMWFTQSAFPWMCSCYRRLVLLFARGKLHTGASQVKRKKSYRSFNFTFRTK